MAHISPLLIWAVTFSLGRGSLTVVLGFFLGHIPLLPVRCFEEQAHHATFIPAPSFLHPELVQSCGTNAAGCWCLAIALELETQDLCALVEDL